MWIRPCRKALEPDRFSERSSPRVGAVAFDAGLEFTPPNRRVAERSFCASFWAVRLLFSYLNLD